MHKIFMLVSMGCIAHIALGMETKVNVIKSIDAFHHAYLEAKKNYAEATGIPMPPTSPAEISNLTRMKSRYDVSMENNGKIIFLIAMHYDHNLNHLVLDKLINIPTATMGGAFHTVSQFLLE